MGMFRRSHSRIADVLSMSYVKDWIYSKWFTEADALGTEASHSCHTHYTLSSYFDTVVTSVHSSFTFWFLFIDKTLAKTKMKNCQESSGQNKITFFQLHSDCILKKYNDYKVARRLKNNLVGLYIESENYHFYKRTGTLLRAGYVWHLFQAEHCLWVQQFYCPLPVWPWLLRWSICATNSYPGVGLLCEMEHSPSLCWTACIEHPWPQLFLIVVCPSHWQPNTHHIWEQPIHTLHLWSLYHLSLLLLWNNT